MQTTLCFDFGNTRLKYAVFNGRDLTTVEVLKDSTSQSIEEVIELYRPGKTILSSVIRHDPSIEQLLASKTKFHKLNHLSRIPLNVSVGKVETIGADRLALSAAAVDLSPNHHNLAIGLGSCITYNFINIFHEFLGGGISPGMYMRFRAMNEHTAFLPMIEPEHNFPLVGYDTKTNLLSGVIIGMAKEIDGFIEAYSQKYSNLNVFLTGGDMKFFVSHLKNKIVAEPNLLFKGLFAISELNN